jgi:hypothetical protein
MCERSGKQRAGTKRKAEWQELEKSADASHKQQTQWTNLMVGFWQSFYMKLKNAVNTFNQEYSKTVVHIKPDTVPGFENFTQFELFFNPYSNTTRKMIVSIDKSLARPQILLSRPWVNPSTLNIALKFPQTAAAYI